tara:strand:- start:391 stop:774 length:384 start_codon:yes stop_codon:yes gene_type:complete
MNGQKLPKPFLAEGVDPKPFNGFDRDDKRPGYGYVYVFAECSKNGILMGNVKIGYTNSITRRYKDIQHYNGNRIKVMGYWRGEDEKMKRFETIAHHTAMDNHRHGEWFHFKNTREIEQLVESISEHA